MRVRGLPTANQYPVRLRRIILTVGLALGLLALWFWLFSASAPGQAYSIATSGAAGDTNQFAVQFVGSIGGSADAVALSGTRAYLGEGAALTILDVSNPALPVRRARMPLPDLVRDIQVVGSLAYVADREGGLQIIDVSAPLSPTLRGVYDTPGNAYGTQVEGGLVYVADWNGGLQILRVVAYYVFLPLIMR